MKIIIVGGGKVGTTLCEQLTAEGHSVTLVDADSRSLNNMVEKYDISGVVGNGVVSSTLLSAGVTSADLCIACTPSDEVNILCCTVADKLGAKKTIARVRDPEYFNTFTSSELGLDMLVNPEYEASMEIARILNYPYAVKVEEFVGGSLRMLEYKIPCGSPLAGKSLVEVAQAFKVRILICCVVRGDNTFIPEGSFTLECGDHIFVTAENVELHKFFRQVAVKRKSHRVFILGGGRIAFYLIKRLVDSGTDVVLIEKDADECRKFYENFSNISVINADGFQQHILTEQGVLGADAVVALSADDEKNVLISMFVDTLGKKAIVKTDKTEYVAVLEKAGIESIILPKLLTANIIVRFVRSLTSHASGMVAGFYRMVGSSAEFVEFVAGEAFSGLDKPLRELKLKKNTIIAAIARGGVVTVPGGNDVINIGDTVLVASTEAGFDDLGDILE
jgi:trk system potassium uptake protein TrkA